MELILKLPSLANKLSCPVVYQVGMPGEDFLKKQESFKESDLYLFFAITPPTVIQLIPCWLAFGNGNPSFHCAVIRRKEVPFEEWRNMVEKMGFQVWRI